MCYRLFTSVAVVAGALFLSSCAYKVGNIAGEDLKGISSVYVPVVKNETYEPNIAVLVTDALVQRFHSDGTLSVRRQGNADSTLEVKLIEFERHPTRSTRSDTRLVAEYQVVLTAEVTFTRKSDGKVIVRKEKISGDTEFFIGNDLQEGERQAMGLVADRLAKKVVERITEGW